MAQIDQSEDPARTQLAVQAGARCRRRHRRDEPGDQNVQRAGMTTLGRENRGPGLGPAARHRGPHRQRVFGVGLGAGGESEDLVLGVAVAVSMATQRKLDLWVSCTDSRPAPAGSFAFDDGVLTPMRAKNKPATTSIQRPISGDATTRGYPSGAPTWGASWRLGLSEA